LTPETDAVHVCSGLSSQAARSYRTMYSNESLISPQVWGLSFVGWMARLVFARGLAREFEIRQKTASTVHHRVQGFH
jgi:hypothetical protein